MTSDTRLPLSGEGVEKVWVHMCGATVYVVFCEVRRGVWDNPMCRTALLEGDKPNQEGMQSGMLWIHRAPLNGEGENMDRKQKLNWIHCAKSLLYDSVYLCVYLRNAQNITCVVYLKCTTAYI